MKKLQPFKIEIAQPVLDDLQQRLAATRWPDANDQDGWYSGTNTAYLKSLVDHWQHQYNWREHEAAINNFDQFTADVNGVNIHFIYVKGKGPAPTPLLLSHGWPDSFYRYLKVIPMLTDPERYGGKAADAFDVIIPSLPGFGFSDRKPLAHKPLADLWVSLMTETLGYEKFVASGGDVSAEIVKAMALHYPEVISAIHLTDVGYPNGSEDWASMSPAELAFGQFIQQWWFTEGAYNMEQSTKPQTLAAGLTDSPVGLAAWIIEKFYSWSACNNDLDDHFTKDELLTNIMIYWVTNTIGSSVRMYQEVARATYAQPGGPQPAVRSVVPAAVVSFPGEAPAPREWAERNVNVQQYTKMDKGGHFAALEVPELFTQTVWAVKQLL